MIQILEKCVRPLYKGEKGMPFINFKIVDAKNLNMEGKKTAKRRHIYSLRF